MKINFIVLLTIIYSNGCLEEETIEQNMTRKKVKLAFITNDSARKATFNKRKKGLMKKPVRVSTGSLAGHAGCPLRAGAVQRMPGMEQSKKMVNQESFIQHRITKASEQWGFAIIIQYNSLSGNLGPAFFPNHTNLQVLNLTHNHLSVVIFSQVLVSLRVLDLSSNSFYGEIPTNFSVTHQLQLINLSFNDFSGAIPATIGALQQLQYLRVDSNKLYDTIPSAEMMNLTALFSWWEFIYWSSSSEFGGSLPAGIIGFK
ncbi:putative LRR receptor-like serine/threonine-protein kinase [Forsythia ovata]|uniref:LRR receptor-like serine/threonine-protein kinase n=1 Tax=Forsythia ovata TaxID=205694 RepID=A0ABD1TSS7_9LAMI